MHQSVDSDVKILEENFNIKINTVSFHQPSESILNGEVVLDKYINAYDKKYFKDVIYLLDSNKIWKKQHPIEIFKSKEFSKIQLLIHPMWWV